MMRERILSQSDEDNQIVNVELPTRSWRAQLGLLSMEETGFDYPETQKERGLYAAYWALMESGFSITSGANYGADFLVFKGQDLYVFLRLQEFD